MLRHGQWRRAPAGFDPRRYDFQLATLVYVAVTLAVLFGKHLGGRGGRLSNGAGNGERGFDPSIAKLQPACDRDLLVGDSFGQHACQRFIGQSSEERFELGNGR